MNFKEIQCLVQLFERTNIRELKIDNDKFHIYLTKDQATKLSQIKNLKQNNTLHETTKKTHKEIIKSSLVGTVYLTPTPTSSPYVKVGDHVNKGETVCVIESMKMMTEIKSDVSGIISAILVENEELVEVNQPLFAISTEK